MDTRFHASPAQIGMIFTVSSIGTLAGTLIIAKNAHRISPKIPLMAGFSLFALAQWPIPHISLLWLIALPAFFSLLYAILPVSWVFYVGSILAVIMLMIVCVTLPFRESHD